jgi:hypothetical protein
MPRKILKISNLALKGGVFNPSARINSDKSCKKVLQYSMTTREIEFDPEKAATNLQAHKITFEDAALFFC